MVLTAIGSTQRVFAIDVPILIDDFNRPDSDDLGLDWVELLGDTDISSNQMRSMTGSHDKVLQVDVLPTSNQQYIELDLPACNFGQPYRVWMYLRSDVTVSNAYGVLTKCGQYEADLYRINSGSNTLLTTFASLDLSVKTRIRLFIEDNGSSQPVLYYYNDDILKGSYTDTSGSAITSGVYTGLDFPVQDTYIDNYESGSSQIPTPTPTASPTPTATPSATPSPTATPSASLGLQDEIGFQFLGQIISFTLGLTGYILLSSNLYKR